METITNAANAASKAIWGENNNASAETGQEPLAGEQGRGTADSPYDRGNAEGQSGSAGPDAGSSNPGPTSGSTGTGLQPGIPSSGSQSQGTNIAGQIRPEHQQDKTGVTGLHSDDPKFSDQRPSDSNAASTSDRGQKAPAGGIGAAEPSSKDLC
ncbi:hypothetical protein L228DRAFT_17009 [Xylona heveae TC161]|uniref:Uncharacterized protein n=1 Tax=Xylona heveae (strain CBS 132557 / TC161) TaxID=1328760 RepID=A0A165JW94_XYLHT|nr:hypothetical protein L228DRAFT_17009 [Xylona heveae TC161]KZF26702.1 hypothetical protein L228DRAFT_17009 [Xylona heveae TC161]